MTTQAPDWPASAFWAFSLWLYAQPGVEAACLTLQDHHRLDVNLVLLAGWAAHRGRRLTPASARRARDLGDAYQATVMQPLRQTRHALKAHDPGSALRPLLTERRRALLGLELDLERLEQLQLERLLDTVSDAPSPSDAPGTRKAANDGGADAGGFGAAGIDDARIDDGGAGDGGLGAATCPIARRFMVNLALLYTDRDLPAAALAVLASEIGRDPG